MAEEEPAAAVGAADAAEAAAGASVAGGAAGVDADDDAGVCAALFRGLVFYLGREVPREALLLVIRAFGGTVGWQGDGSPIDESDEAITHQVKLASALKNYCNLSWSCSSLPCSNGSLQ